MDDEWCCSSDCEHCRLNVRRCDVYRLSGCFHFVLTATCCYSLPRRFALNRVTPFLPFQALALPNDPNLELPAIPLHALSLLAIPRPDSPAITCRTRTYPITPRLSQTDQACNSLPVRFGPSLSLTSLTTPATPYESLAGLSHSRHCKHLPAMPRLSCQNGSCLFRRCLYRPDHASPAMPCPLRRYETCLTGTILPCNEF